MRTAQPTGTVRGDMAATPEQRADFGRRLRELRVSKGLRQEDLAAVLTRADGANVSKAIVSEYERGVSAPSVANTKTLEDFFDEPRGALCELLGYRGDDPAMRAELAELAGAVAQLQDVVTQQGEQLAEILRRLPPRRGTRGSS